MQNAPAEASAALNNIETLRRLLKNATDYKQVLQTNRKLADLLLPFFNPSTVIAPAAVVAAPAPLSPGGSSALIAARQTLANADAAPAPLSPGGSSALIAARLALANVDAAREVVAAAASAAPAASVLTTVPTLSKIKTKLPPWWV